jgi:hypothetical protein
VPVEEFVRDHLVTIAANIDGDRVEHLDQVGAVDRTQRTQFALDPARVRRR